MKKPETLLLLASLVVLILIYYQQTKIWQVYQANLEVQEEISEQVEELKENVEKLQRLRNPFGDRQI